MSRSSSFEYDFQENDKRAFSGLAKMGDRIAAVVNPMKRTISRAQAGYRSAFSSDSSGPDFARIDDYIELEGVLSLTVQRHLEQIMNAGWELKSKNPAAARYVQDRLYEMGQRMKEPIGVTFRSIFHDLISFSNVLCNVRRDSRTSPGTSIKQTQTREELPPISAIETMPVPTARYHMDTKKNRPSKWKFSSTKSGLFSSPVEINERNILHIYLNRKPGNIYGTPWLMPVLDDVQDLRAVEAVVNSIVSQQGAPLTHIKIENPIIDRSTKTSEIDTVTSAIENGALEGGIYVSDARHTIEQPVKEVKLDGYRWILGHYKGRVREGCNLSDIDLGQGDSANRNTATTLTEKGVSRCKYISEVACEFITYFLIDPLLMEGGFDWTFNDDTNRVYFCINEIDIDRKMRHETHAMMLWEGNGITHTELRDRINQEPYTEEQWKDSHLELISIKLAEVQAEAKATAAAQRQQGTNQHGSSPSPKTRKDEMVELLIEDAFEHYKSGCKWADKKQEIATKEEAAKMFKVAERLDKVKDDDAASVRMADFVRAEAFLSGARDVKPVTPIRDE